MINDRFNSLLFSFLLGIFFFLIHKRYRWRCKHLDINCFVYILSKFSFIIKNNREKALFSGLHRMIDL